MSVSLTRSCLADRGVLLTSTATAGRGPLVDRNESACTSQGRGYSERLCIYLSPRNWHEFGLARYGPFQAVTIGQAFCRLDAGASLAILVGGSVPT